MIVVADTSPLNYLILIDQIHLLELLYGEVLIPPAVQHEMLTPKAPDTVRAWIAHPPRWLKVRTPGQLDASLDPALDQGEREAITLARAIHPSTLLLIDERLGRQEARRIGLQVTGTLGILLEAHERGHLKLQHAIEQLNKTSFQASDALLKSFLDRV